jgi:hypothetical protein
MSNLRDFYRPPWPPMNWMTVIADSTLEINQGFFVDTLSASITITLPTSPIIGDEVGIADYSGSFATNNCIVYGNGNNIMGSASNYIINSSLPSFIFVYSDATTGWVIMSNNIEQISRRNHIINGNFDIWQRRAFLGNPQVFSGYGSDDRWFNGNNGSTKTHSRESFTIGQTEVPNNPQYYSRTTVYSVTGLGNYVCKYQKIENVVSLSEKTLTLSFWAKADTNRDIAIEVLQDFGVGGSTSVEVHRQLINITSSWKRYVITFDTPSVLGKTLGTSPNTDIIHSLLVKFWFDAGANFSANSSGLGQQSGVFDISQAQLEVGVEATLFDNRPVGEELTLCHRFFQEVWGVVCIGMHYRCFYLDTKLRTRSPVIAWIHINTPGPPDATFIANDTKLIQVTMHPSQSEFRAYLDGEI